MPTLVLTLECNSRVRFSLEPFKSDEEAQANAHEVEAYILNELRPGLPSGTIAAFKNTTVIRDNLTHQTYLHLVFDIGMDWLVAYGSIHTGWRLLEEYFRDGWKKQQGSLVLGVETEIRQVSNDLPAPKTAKPKHPVMATIQAAARRYGNITTMIILALLAFAYVKDQQEDDSRLLAQLRAMAPPHVVQNPTSGIQTSSPNINVYCPQPRPVVSIDRGSRTYSSRQ